jgi:DNA-binding NtrC family response regulator
METRSLVYLYLKEEPACRPLIQAMRADGWHIQVVDSIEQAAQAVQQEGVGLGIIHFGETLDPDIPLGLERLMQLTPTAAWIGIIPPERLIRLIDVGLIPGYFHDYHTEPVDPLRLSQCLGHAYGMAHASKHANRVQHRDPSSAGMIGVSEQMQQVFKQIGKIASVDASVMISGSSGTGKELAARSIHNRSARGKGPFVAINCGAISPALIHSELFGHERGAFTGAHRRKIGRLEAADGGTIFLDEIADLPLDQQVNLLRFLQERTIERVGGMDPIPIDVRVITASHVDLHDAVAKGEFREDLFYRLNVVQLRMPDLRERVEDIEPLARYFFSIFAKERNHNVSGFSQQALQAMRDYSWPGNVRELINRVRRATIMCEHRLITPQELELFHAEPELATETLAQVRIDAERQAILAGLRQSSNNVSEAARRLGVARMTLYRLMQKHRINAGEGGQSDIDVSASFGERTHPHPMSIIARSGDSR